MFTIQERDLLIKISVRKALDNRDSQKHAVIRDYFHRGKKFFNCEGGSESVAEFYLSLLITQFSERKIASN